MYKRKRKIVIKRKKKIETIKKLHKRKLKYIKITEIFIYLFIYICPLISIPFFVISCHFFKNIL